jgi:hypothetical protein
VVPVVRLSGVIGFRPAETGLTLRAARARWSAPSARKARAVALLINSPAARRCSRNLPPLHALAAENKRPVIAFAESRLRRLHDRCRDEIICDSPHSARSAWSAARSASPS